MRNKISIEELGQPFKALTTIDIFYKKYLVRLLHLAAVSAFFYGSLDLAWPICVVISALISLPPYPGSPYLGAVLGSIGAVTVWQWPVVAAIAACFSWIIVSCLYMLLFMYLINSRYGPKL